MMPGEALVRGHCEAFPVDVITPRDSYAWNYRELVTFLTLSESLA